MDTAEKHWGQSQIALWCKMGHPTGHGTTGPWPCQGPGPLSPRVSKSQNETAKVVKLTRK